MSIFGNDESYGSLGMGAPDTGRGNAFDRLALKRGYGLSPDLGETQVEIGTPRARRIPPGAIVGGIEFGTAPAQPITSGGYFDMTPLSGLGAVARKRALPLGRFRLQNGSSAALAVEVIDRATGRVVRTVRIPPRGSATVAVTPRRLYGFRYTAVFHKETSSRERGIGVESGASRTVSLNTY